MWGAAVLRPYRAVFVLEFAVRVDVRSAGGSVAYRDLREFVRKLEKEGELKRVRTEVDPILEITEVTQRVTRAQGPALLFEKPRGSRVPLLVNAFGSVRRMCLAFEVGELDEVAGGGRGVLGIQAPPGRCFTKKKAPKQGGRGSVFFQARANTGWQDERGPRD